MRRIPFYVLVCSLTAATLLPAQKKPRYPEDALEQAQIEKDLRFLAADELMGRMTGEPGNDVAARYIAESFRKAGLKPIPGSDDYLQPVPLQRLYPPAKGFLTIGGDTLRYGDKVLTIRNGHDTSVVGPVVFLNYGYVDAEQGIDDYGDREVAGKIIVVKFGIPNNTSPMAAFRSLTQKERIAAEKGAIALVHLYPGGFPWPALQRRLMQPAWQLADSSANGEASGLLNLLLNDIDGTMTKQLTEAGELAGAISLHGSRTEPVRSYNVFGMLEGRDAKLKQEYIGLVAHFDHVGVRRGEEGVAQTDSIYNGARDNGAGTVAVLAAARALAQAPPARSVFFLAVTAEEVGLLGSRYYVDSPIVPLEQTVYCLNIDGAGYNDTTIVTLIGHGRTTADALIERATNDFGLGLLSDPSPEQNLFNRSDNVSFVRKGIPSPTFSLGFRAFDAAIMAKYHQVGDEVDADMDFNYLRKFCQSYVRAARYIADAPKPPFWVEGDENAETGRQLYGR